MKFMKNTFFAGTAFLLLASIGAGAATISGTVTTGGGGGGGGGTPVAGAKVVLSSGFFGGGGGGTRLDSTVTSATGTYSFTTDSLGFKRVIVSKTGFQTGQGFANVQSRTGAYTINVQLTADGGGGSTGKVSGTVRTSATIPLPVANALVIITGGGGGGGRPTYVDSARTNALGVYTLDSVPAVNNFTVRVTATGFNPAINNNVDVTAGVTTTANFTLTALVGPPTPGSISGTIRNSAGAAVIAGAKVVLIRAGGGAARVDSMVTLADGHYAFDSVAAMAGYTVTVTATGFQPASSTNITVASNTTSTVDISLIANVVVPTGSIIGHVTNTGSGKIVGAKVVLSRAGGNGNGIIDSTVTNALGQYFFDSIPALQNYTVTVSASGYQSAINNNVDMIAGQAVLADFILVSNGTQVRSAWNSESGFRLSQVHGALSLDFGASALSGSVRVFTLSGVQAYSAQVPAGATHLSLPNFHQASYLVISRGGHSDRLLVPASL